MKRTLCVLMASGALLITAAAAQAQSRHGFELGLEGYKFTYKEDEDDGSTFIETEGRMVGVSLEYARPVGGLELELRSRFTGGEVDYEAFDGDTLNDVAQATVQLEATLGRSFPVSPTGVLTAYAGLGARGHGEEGTGRFTSMGLYAFDRFTFYSYLPLGVKADFRVGPLTTIGLRGQYNLFLGGEIESKTSEIQAGAPDIVAELDDGGGWEFSATVNRAVGTGTVSFGPFIRTWEMDESSIETVIDEGEELAFIEPPSETFEGGFRVAYRF